MTYSTHEPSPYERRIIDLAYMAAREYRGPVVRFIVPIDPPATFIPAAEPDRSEVVPFGEFHREGVTVKGRSGHSPADGMWDKITYGGDEWLVRDGVVLKRSTEKETPDVTD